MAPPLATCRAYRATKTDTLKNINVTLTVIGAYLTLTMPEFTTPTIPTPQLPEQQTKAQQQVDAYFLAVKKGRRHAAKHRYISVETLKPTKKQLKDYTIKPPATRCVDPA